MGDNAIIVGLYRYPVKGLTPEPLAEARLATGETFPWDRAYAIENGKHDFDEGAPKHFPKIKFLMLMRDAKLARLKTHFDDTTATLHIAEGGCEVLAATLTTAEGRAALEAFMTDYMGKDLRGTPRVVHAPGFSLSDVPAKRVSIINMGSVRALEKQIGMPVNPLRFRANIYVEGLEPWADHDWLGRNFTIGEAGFKGWLCTVRCAATNVNPETGVRDMDIPATLLRHRDNAELGLYAEVTSPGTIRPGDRLVLEA